MADQAPSRRHPGYDFYVPGQHPNPGAAPPPPAPPAGWQVPPGAAGAAPPGSAPYPPTFRTPEPAPLPAPSYGPTPLGRSSSTTAVVVVGVIVACLVAVGLAAAVAVPVFYEQRMRSTWRATSVALPETFEGAPRTSAVDALRAQQAPEGMSDVQTGMYRTDNATLLVVAARSREPMSPSEQTQVRRSVLAELSANGAQLSLAETEAGSLGGWFGCGSIADGPVTACLATDSGSLVAVLVQGATDSAGTARRMREASIHR